MKETKINDHLDAHQMSLYIDALKADKLHKVPAPILRHIDQCTICHGEALDLYSMLGEQDYSQSGAHPILDQEAKVFNTRRFFLRIAAAAAMMAMAFFFYQRANDTLPGQNEVVQENPVEQIKPNEETPIKVPEMEKEELQTPAPIEDLVEEKTKEVKRKMIRPKKEPVPELVPVQKDRVLFAANFTPSEHWESMVDETVRGSIFQAKSPEVNAVFTKNKAILFQWTSDQKEGLRLLLLNNKGKEVKVLSMEGNELLFKEKLNPGRYYWKVESTDDLLHVGRFEVAD